MKSTLIKFALFAIVGVFAACSTVTVTTNYDKAASFGKYKTYVLAPALKDQALSPVAEATLRDTLRTQLAARGITEIAGGKADLAIVRHVILLDKVSVQQYTNWGYGHGGGWPYGYGSYHMWSGAPTTYVDVRAYTEGTLILDVVDLHTKTLVFRGTGTALVGGSESNAEKIREAVKKMVDALPVAAH